MVLSAWAIPTDKSHRVLIHNFSFCRFCALRIWDWIFFSSFRIRSEFINREIKAECECAVPVAMQSVIGISHVHGKTLKRNKYIRTIDDTSCATSTIDAERVFNIFIRFSCCVVLCCGRRCRRVHFNGKYEEIQIHISHRPKCANAIFRDYIWSKHLLLVLLEMAHGVPHTHSQRFGTLNAFAIFLCFSPFKIWNIVRCRMRHGTMAHASIVIWLMFLRCIEQQ